MKQKRSDTLGLPDNLVPKRRFASPLRGRTLDFSSFVTVKTVSLVVLIVLLLVLAWILPGYVKRHFGKVAVHSEGRVMVPATTLPEGFPPDLPFIDSKTVLHNFTSDLSGGLAEGVRKWKVSKSVSDIGAAYETYFRANGWEITTSLKTDEKVLLAAVKTGKMLSVSVQTSPEAGTSLIEASVRTQEDKNSSNL